VLVFNPPHRDIKPKFFPNSLLRLKASCFAFLLGGARVLYWYFIMKCTNTLALR